MATKEKNNSVQVQFEEIKKEENKQYYTMGLIGNIEPYLPGENFSSWVARVEQFFIVNDVQEAKRVPLFITLIGAEAYEVLSSLTVPLQPKDKTLNQLLKILNDHFEPKANEIAERYKFYSRNQKEGEPMADYIVEIKSLASTCNFNSFLEEALRDRLVCGVCSSALRAKLLSEPSLTWEKAKNFATTDSLTQKNMLTMERDYMVQNAIVTRDSNKPNYNNSGAYKKTFTKNKQKEMVNCTKCGRSHAENECRARNFVCFYCSRRGHLASMCFKKRREEEENRVIINSIKNGSLSCIVHIQINNVAVKFEVDSGAAVTVLEECSFRECFKNISLTPFNNNLWSCGGHLLTVVGQAAVKVGVNNLNLVIVKGLKSQCGLLGRDWLDILYPGWREFFKTSTTVNIIQEINMEQPNLIKKFPHVFSETLREPIKSFKADVYLRENSVPIFKSAYTVPYKLREAVDNELKRMCDEKIIEQIQHSCWASSIVAVPKKDSVRICVDFKSTLNKCIEREHYPLPQISDCLSELAGASMFCALDMTGAYQQVSVNDTSKELLTINTHRGLFRFLRLPFGLSSAPSIFQNIMDQMLVGIKGVVCYLDDILIYGKDRHECSQRLDQVLERFNDFNVRVNSKKCKFFVDTIDFLGHVISSTGIKPNPEKTKAVLNAPPPNNLKELQAYLGLINFYGKFIPNISTKLYPLYELLRKDNKFNWTQECENSFKDSKKLLSENTILHHFDPSKEIIVACDASPYGIGAVLSVVDDGLEKPVYFISRVRQSRIMHKYIERDCNNFCS